MPRRWRGKTAEALPTWPYATCDWMERTFTTGETVAHPAGQPSTTVDPAAPVPASWSAADELALQGVELAGVGAPDRGPDHRAGQGPRAAGDDVGDQGHAGARPGRFDAVGVVGGDPALPGAEGHRPAGLDGRDLADALLAAGGEAQGRPDGRGAVRANGVDAEPAGGPVPVDEARPHPLRGPVDRPGGGERCGHARRVAGGPASRLGRSSPLRDETRRGVVVRAEVPALRREVGRGRDTGVSGDVADQVRLVEPA